VRRPITGRKEQTRVDEIDAGGVGELAEEGGADAAHGED
jgi:hypothetical protein